MTEYERQYAMAIDQAVMDTAIRNWNNEPPTRPPENTFAIAKGFIDSMVASGRLTPGHSRDVHASMVRMVQGWHPLCRVAAQIQTIARRS